MSEAYHIDFETGSAVDIRKAGVFRYAEDPSTVVWGFRYRQGTTGPKREWRPGWPDPQELLAHVAAGGTVTAHNAAFEREIWNTTLRTKYAPHWPRLEISQQDCTMVRAAVVAHPQGLDKLGEALGTSFRKDAEGQAAMMKLSKPRSQDTDGSYIWWNEEYPELLERSMAYCGTDVEVETEVDTLLPPLTPRTRALWELDQKINERGVRFDRAFVERAAEFVSYTKKQNDKLVRSITSREVSKCSRDREIIDWLNRRGIECSSLAKGVIDDVKALAMKRRDHVAIDVIALRAASWKTSTAKYAAVLNCICKDGRVRGLLNCHGAATGRFAGRLVQPQNFPRVDPDDLELQATVVWIRHLLEREENIDAFDGVRMCHGDLAPMTLMSKCLRSAIVADDDKILVGGDYSNIEGRVNAWVAGEHWKLQAFQDFDDGTGHDLYKLAYAKSFGEPVESIGKGYKRQLGKVQELALGYQGSVGAFMSMGANYGMDPYDLIAPVYEATSENDWLDAIQAFHNPNTHKFELSPDAWAALKVTVNGWRKANSAIMQSWWNYQDAAIEAVTSPGCMIHPAHTTRVGYYYDGAHLWCVLPSGRMLCYSSAEVKRTKVKRKRADGSEYEAWETKLYAWGVDSVTKQWRKQSLYGGHLCENIVQAIAADILIDAMFKVEAAGFPIVLTVHDEIVAEVLRTLEAKHLNERYFKQLMADIDLNIYAGLPTAVDVWTDPRYIK